MPKTLRTFVRSHVGLVRSQNEDRCAVSAIEGTPVNWTGELARDGGWALLADGLGGHVAGDVASSLAIEVMRPMMSRLMTDTDIEEAVDGADTGLFLAMDMRPELRGMGTTIAGAVLRSSETITFNVGDSRIYELAKGEFRQTSRDHTRGGALLQCLGGWQEPSRLLVHVHRHPPNAAILLCSDGLTDMLPDASVAAILGRQPDDPADSLVEAAVAAGGHDNVSVVFLEAFN